MSDFDALPAAISVPKGRTAPRLELRLTPFAASCDLPSRRFGDRICVVTPPTRDFSSRASARRMTLADPERDGH